MIKEFVDLWFLHKEKIEAKFKEKHPSSYIDVIRLVISMLNENMSDSTKPDTDRIHEIDDGDYQGTLVFIVGETGYQPSTYWYVKVYYGSCSGCDTLEAIKNYDDDKLPTEDQVKQYMTLALHVIQNIKLMGDSDDL